MNTLPLFEVTRGQIVKSVHYGSIAVVDANGKLIASYGDPQRVAFLRSSAKAFQALPFVERGGVEHYGFAPRELSLACASHEGSDMHVQAVEALQKKIGVEESQFNVACICHLIRTHSGPLFKTTNSRHRIATIAPANIQRCLPMR